MNLELVEPLIINLFMNYTKQIINRLNSCNIANQNVRCITIVNQILDYTRQKYIISQSWFQSR